MPHGRAYAPIWRDVRSAVDLCHRDGTLKREVRGRGARGRRRAPRLRPTHGLPAPPPVFSLG
jgi:hypothetical protein